MLRSRQIVNRVIIMIGASMTLQYNANVAGIVLFHILLHMMMFPQRDTKERCSQNYHNKKTLWLLCFTYAQLKVAVIVLLMCIVMLLLYTITEIILIIMNIWHMVRHTLASDRRTLYIGVTCKQASIILRFVVFI